MLRLRMDEAREFDRVLSGHHPGRKKLGIPRYHLQRSLHLMRNIRRERTAHILCTHQFAILLAKLLLLLFDATEQRVHLKICLLYTYRCV